MLNPAHMGVKNFPWTVCRQVTLQQGSSSRTASQPCSNMTVTMRRRPYVLLSLATTIAYSGSTLPSGSSSPFRKANVGNQMPSQHSLWAPQRAATHGCTAGYEKDERPTAGAAGWSAAHREDVILGPESPPQGCSYALSQ